MEIKVTKIKKSNESKSNLEYWSAKSSDDKLDAVQQLREQYISLFNKQKEYDESRKRLRRFYKVIKQS